MARTGTLASVEIATGLDIETEPLRPRLADPEEPFRILVCGDFSGGVGRNRRPMGVDRDNFDTVLALVAPQIRVNGGPFLFRTIDDFHPDNLLRQPGRLSELCDLRMRLTDPVAFRKLAADIAPRAYAAPAPPPELANVPGAELLRRIIDEPAAGDGGREWDRLIREMGKQYAVPGPDPRQAEWIARADAALSAELSTVLHCPAFQALEAAWRGLEFLVRRAGAGENVKIYVLDLPHAALTTGGLGDLARALEQESWGVMAGLYYFGAKDEETLQRIAALAQEAQTPFLAGLAHEAVGSAPVFESLRRSLKAFFLGLATPRFLLRLPYGSQTVPVETLGYEEMPPPPEHEHYLWGHPALACACLLAQSFERDGWRMRPGTVSEIDGLPAHSYEWDGESELQPCAERLMTEKAASDLLERGFMPLASIKGTDRIRLVRFQSMARPSAPLAGKWK